jgi:hypothetical protein
VLTVVDLYDLRIFIFFCLYTLRLVVSLVVVVVVVVVDVVVVVLVVVDVVVDNLLFAGNSDG